MRRATIVAAVVLVLGALAGCGLRDPDNQPSVSAAPRATPAPPPAPAGRSAAPAIVDPSAGAPDSAQRTLYEFAQTYGQITETRRSARIRRLLTLSTPKLAQTIAADVETMRHADPIAGRASIASQIVNLDLAPTRGNRCQAVVVLEQRLTRADGSSEPPITDLFQATLERTPQGWRIAAFTPQQ